MIYTGGVAMETVFKKESFEIELEKHGIVLSEKQRKQFETYADMLVEWNNKMNLTAITQIDEIYEKHFLDSILPSFDVKLEGTLCDVGAGAGFPSIPLKIIYPSLKVTIVETLQKRITFLTALCNALELEGVTLEHARAEDYAKTHRESFDIVSARAVANLSMLSELCIPLVRKDGIFLAMKGANGEEELKKAQKAYTLLGCQLEAGFESNLSDGAMRINYVFRKTKATPAKYPRAFAAIKKSPL